LAYWQEKVASLPEAAEASGSRVSFCQEAEDNERKRRVEATEEAREAEKQPMDVEFFADGKTIILRFVRTPLGMQFTNKKRPLVVVSLVQPGSHADELGVKVDWQIKKIAGKDVVKLEKFKELSAFWKEQVASIPGAIMAPQEPEETIINETEPQLTSTEETQEPLEETKDNKTEPQLKTTEDRQEAEKQQKEVE